MCIRDSINRNGNKTCKKDIEEFHRTVLTKTKPVNFCQNYDSDIPTERKHINNEINNSEAGKEAVQEVFRAKVATLDPSNNDTNSPSGRNNDNPTTDVNGSEACKESESFSFQDFFRTSMTVVDASQNNVSNIPIDLQSEFAASLSQHLIQIQERGRLAPQQNRPHEEERYPDNHKNTGGAVANSMTKNAAKISNGEPHAKRTRLANEKHSFLCSTVTNQQVDASRAKAAAVDYPDDHSEGSYGVGLDMLNEDNATMLISTSPKRQREEHQVDSDDGPKTDGHTYGNDQQQQGQQKQADTQQQFKQAGSRQQALSQEYQQTPLEQQKKVLMTWFALQLRNAEVNLQKRFEAHLKSQALEIEQLNEQHSEKIEQIKNKATATQNEELEKLRSLQDKETKKKTKDQLASHRVQTENLSLRHAEETKKLRKEHGELSRKVDAMEVDVVAKTRLEKALEEYSPERYRILALFSDLKEYDFSAQQIMRKEEIKYRKMTKAVYSELQMQQLHHFNETASLRATISELATGTRMSQRILDEKTETIRRQKENIKLLEGRISQMDQDQKLALDRENQLLSQHHMQINHLSIHNQQHERSIHSMHFLLNQKQLAYHQVHQQLSLTLQTLQQKEREIQKLTEAHKKCTTDQQKELEYLRGHVKIAREHKEHELRLEIKQAYMDRIGEGKGQSFRMNILANTVRSQTAEIREHADTIKRLKATINGLSKKNNKLQAKVDSIVGDIATSTGSCTGGV